MKCFMVGLGSMGKRRIRCLQALGHTHLVGFDIRPDRMQDARNEYGIETIDSLVAMHCNEFDCMFVSTPPDRHNEYLKFGIEHVIPTFVEASVVLAHVQEIYEMNKSQSLFIAPSCTMKFHPMVKELKRIVHSGKYGKLTNFTYHTGQYLSDWHPWENVQDFYVSHRLTGGAREIVPFELTWLTEIFGDPYDIKGYFQKTTEIGANIEDSYAFVLRFSNAVACMLVDVVSRFATRSLLVNLEKCQLRWNWEEGLLKIFEVEHQRWISCHQTENIAAKGYNKNIIEAMYLDETKAFIDGIQTPRSFPNSLENDLKILQLLEALEDSDGGF